MDMYEPVKYQPETHVITVGLHFIEELHETTEIHEVFRGDEAECKAICARMSACSHDRRRLSAVHVTCGTIAEWEEFLRSN
jgi:hypothetical protein